MPWRARILLPYTRRELPGWGALLRVAGLYGDEAWTKGPTCELAGKWHGYRMTLDLSDPNDRFVYFCGRYQESETQVFVLATLRPGDTFVDVGANSGMMTLLGARCVGPAGLVRSFEPNPEVLRRLRSHVEGNHLAHVRVVAAGLSEDPGTLTLHVISKHSGWSTFADLRPQESEALTAEHRAEVLRGDDALADLPDAPLMIKIDVEGFECRVIKGLAATIRRHRPAVLTEAVPEHLERAGSSIAELFELMVSHGYKAFALRTRRRWTRHRLHLTETGLPLPIGVTDVVWLHPDGAHIRRLPRKVLSRAGGSAAGLPAKGGRD